MYFTIDNNSTRNNDGNNKGRVYEDKKCLLFLGVRQESYSCTDPKGITLFIKSALTPHSKDPDSDSS